jgi:hypothetical protein
MIQPNGLALATVCTGINITRVPMYFVSAQRAFIWDTDASDLTVNPAKPLVADMVGAMDIQVGGPFGGATDTQIATGTFGFGFEGVAGNFNNTHTPVDGFIETGTVVFNTTGTKCVITTTPPSTCTVGTNGVLEQTGTATFTLDLANGAGTQKAVTFNATFTFNDDADGETDNVEGFGSLVYSAPAFQAPDHFQVVSSKKILLLYCGTANATPPTCNSHSTNLGGVAEQH